MDNFWKDCPPVMNDGRIFRDHRTAITREETVKALNKMNNNDTYRLFLMNNASKIMANQFAQYKLKSSCWKNQCVHTYPSRQNPATFVEERMRHDTILNPAAKQRFPCEPFVDYTLQ